MKKQDFRVGDRVIVRSKGISTSAVDCNGLIGTIIKTSSEVTNSLGGKGYAVLDIEHNKNGIWFEELELLTNKNTMQKLNSMMKRLLDADTKKLVQAGLINGDLELTDEGIEALRAIEFEGHKAELVKIAEEKIAEEK